MTNEYGFRSLVVWQRAQELAVAVVRAMKVVPRNSETLAMKSQLVRSAGSVSANIAEGYGRFYEQAYRNHLSIARGSLFETENWLDLLVRSGYLSSEVAGPLFDSCHEVGRLLTQRMRALDSKSSRLKEESANYDANFDPEEL